MIDRTITDNELESIVHEAGQRELFDVLSKPTPAVKRVLDRTELLRKFRIESQRENLADELFDGLMKDNRHGKELLRYMAEEYLDEMAISLIDPKHPLYSCTYIATIFQAAAAAYAQKEIPEDGSADWYATKPNARAYGEVE